MNDQANYRSDKKTETLNFKPESITLQYDLGVKDSKGRKIGAFVTTRFLVYTEIPSEKLAKRWSWSTTEPGEFFAVRVHATRDGKRYGATQNELLFKSNEGRLTYIKKYLADARKRAYKNRGTDTAERYSVVDQRRESGEWAGDR